MGLFGKKETAIPEAAVKEQIASVPRPKGTVIAEGMTLEGVFITDEYMDIQGVVKGDIQSSVDTHVSEGGLHIGTMEVKTLHIDGTVEADVVCSELASLSPTAHYRGTMTTANLDSEHGSNFEGTLNLNKK